MNEVFEQGAQQKLVLYTEGNEIIAGPGLPPAGQVVNMCCGEGYLADLTAVVLENTHPFLPGIHWSIGLYCRIFMEDGDQVVLSDAMNASQYGGTAACEPGRKTLAVLYSEGTCRISLERVSVPTRGGRGCPGNFREFMINDRCWRFTG